MCVTPCYDVKNLQFDWIRVAWWSAPLRRPHMQPWCLHMRASWWRTLLRNLWWHCDVMCDACCGNYLHPSGHVVPSMLVCGWKAWQRSQRQFSYNYYDGTDETTELCLPGFYQNKNQTKNKVQPAGIHHPLPNTYCSQLRSFNCCYLPEYRLNAAIFFLKTSLGAEFCTN